jgi:ABC-type transport system substrate-binding protein
MLSSVDKVEAPDKYTVKFTLKEPYVWFLDMLANSHAGGHHRQGSAWKSSAT